MITEKKIPDIFLAMDNRLPGITFSRGYSIIYTFATTVTLANNISMESVSKMLGHSDMTITKQYARILDLTLINEMSNLAKKQY